MFGEKSKIFERRIGKPPPLRERREDKTYEISYHQQIYKHHVKLHYELI